MTEPLDFVTRWIIVIVLAVLATPVFANECTEYRAALDEVHAFDEDLPDEIASAFDAVVKTTEPSIEALTAVQTALDTAHAAIALLKTLPSVLESSIAGQPTNIDRASRILTRALELQNRAIVTAHETVFLAHCTRP